METSAFIWSNDAESRSHEVLAMTVRDFHLVAGSEAAPYLNYCRKKKKAAVHRNAWRQFGLKIQYGILIDL